MPFAPKCRLHLSTNREPNAQTAIGNRVSGNGTGIAMTVNEGPIEAIIEANVVTDNDVRLSLALDAATVSGNTICGNGQDITFEDDARPEIGEDADCEALAAASGS